jgi:hypothetical protein
MREGPLILWHRAPRCLNPALPISHSPSCSHQSSHLHSRQAPIRHYTEVGTENQTCTLLGLIHFAPLFVFPVINVIVTKVVRSVSDQRIFFVPNVYSVRIESPTPDEFHHKPNTHRQGCVRHSTAVVHFR